MGGNNKHVLPSVHHRPPGVILAVEEQDDGKHAPAASGKKKVTSKALPNFLEPNKCEAVV